MTGRVLNQPGQPGEDTVAITGRFQPFHLDHLDLVRVALELGDCVIVAITNPWPGAQTVFKTSPHRHLPAANPFTFEERRLIIANAIYAAGLDGRCADIVPFPLEAPADWHTHVATDTLHLVRIYSDWEHDKANQLENGGYTVKRISGNPATRISATEIRAAMSRDQRWQHWVPAGARETLASFGSAMLRTRCTAPDSCTENDR
jgi:cytidyltransferase-like protein